MILPANCRPILHKTSLLHELIDSVKRILKMTHFERVLEKTHVIEWNMADVLVGPSNPKYAMIADDNADVLAVTKLMLERKAYNVYAFNDSSQALKHIEVCGDCSIVISDIIMPEITGVELAIYVKNARPKIKFVLTSAMIGDPKEWHAILPSRAYIDDFIAKPIVMALSKPLLTRQKLSSPAMPYSR